MARRTFRTGLAAGALTLALVASGCGDSKSDGGGSSGKQNETSQKLAAADCGKLEYDKNAPTGGTFTDYSQLSSNADNTTFDPATTQTLAEAQITTAMWDGLLDFDFTEKCKPELKGLIADKWEANSDATEWTFKLDDRAKFQNGSPVSADAVVYSVQRLIELNQGVAFMFAEILKPEPPGHITRVMIMSSRTMVTMLARIARPVASPTAWGPPDTR